MMTPSRKVSIILAYAGALPFWLLMLAPETVAGFDTASAFVSYGAIISSFMAGTLWGRAQIEHGNILFMGVSNVLALIAFVTLVAGLSLAALFVQLAVFGLLLVADFKSLAQRNEHRWYLVLRLRVTLLVAVAYCVMLVDRALTAGV
ncbi:cellulose synthase/poly-beta-1,6-N-acetylglucosamine synthase-like glycosyltransferase [Rhizobium skierniewicense]|uniref:Cellulose synthase/poly-beta-1,6-N-acetylglucosamine synthase-like glycosyltransferase n=1 Tax=Rhizobium skierniewicense TaxID=984260 RepID=A0A7W6CET2_9HYPH|nr:DUF3429 domain-containing protein [Rhizobium skierniewicense]MBB3948617.1 cellulose synthase/poly-beta-1,6-N-acetylglucosamine synthase-like glycosyltransferase [Rhizobium skierniewicense]